MASIDKAIRSKEVVGSIEDVTDFITALDPDETFFLNRFGSTAVTNTKHEWLNDSLRPAMDNATMEAVVFDAQKARPRVRGFNYVQQLIAGYAVSDTTQAIKKYGVRDELSYQFIKAGKEFARDLEYAIVNNATAKAEDSTAARLGGIGFFLDASKKVAAIDTAGKVTVTGHGLFDGDPVIFAADSGGALDSKYKANTPYYAYVVDNNNFSVHATPQEAAAGAASTAIKPSAAVAAGKMVCTNQNLVDAATASPAGKLTFDLLNDAMQLAWKRGGKIDSIVCSPKNKRTISGFVQGVTKNREQTQKELVEVIDVNCFDCVAA